MASALTDRTGPTASWGDAAARRRDVLEAAATILERDGYQALTMRAIGRGASVSPGTIYHHFASKEHVVAALMELHIEELRTTIAAAPRADGVRGVLRAALPGATELWRCIGRTAVGWAPDMLGPDLDVARTPVAADRAWHSMLDTLEAAMREAAAAEGSRLRSSPAVVPFAWAGLMGVADDLLNGWSRSAGVADDELVEFSVDGLARGVTDPVRGRT